MTLESATDSIWPLGNRWDRLEVPDLGVWDPQLSVSVLIPAHDSHLELKRTLASVAAQTYPNHLLEVVVVDDGSDPPLEVPAWFDELRISIVRQERKHGFGAGRARNRAASVAGGDVLLFTDADMVGSRHVVEAHARWHHVVAHAVTMGFTSFVDFGMLTPAQVRELVASDRLGEEFGGTTTGGQEWRETTLAATNDLTVDRFDLFRVVVSSNLGIRTELFEEVGGFRELGIRGVEDIEFGYRVHTAGALLVPDRAAHYWHQGVRFFDTQASRTAKQESAPARRKYIPLPGFRRPGDLSRGAVPRCVLVFDAESGESEAWLAAIESVLASRFVDFELIVCSSNRRDVATAMEAVSDSRLAFVDVPPDTSSVFPTPVVIEVAAPSLWGRHAVGDFVAEALRTIDQPVVVAGDGVSVRAVPTRFALQLSRVSDVDGIVVPERRVAARRIGVVPYSAEGARRAERERSRSPRMLGIADLAHDARRAGVRSTLRRVKRAAGRLGRIGRPIRVRP